MIKSITFKSPKSVSLSEHVHPGYEFTLPALKGKTFEFSSGLNVVVGKNGVGKTSLLNVIRVLTFCKGQFGSKAEAGSFCPLKLRNLWEDGYWHLAELKSPYTKATINLRKKEDISYGDEMSDMASFGQSLLCGRRSKGEISRGQLGMMIGYLVKGEGAFSSTEEEGNKAKYTHLNFKTMVLDKLVDWEAHHNDSYRPIWQAMLKYYQDRAIKTNALEKEWVTLLMDEPDAGMDINNVQETYDWLTSLPEGFQTIIVLHNIGIIHRLKAWGKANFVELSPGYVNTVEEFFHGSSN